MGNLSIGWDLLFATALGAVALWYFTDSRALPLWRQISFGAGLTLSAVVLVGPVAHAAIHTFSIHMVQHISLMMLISPLLSLGAPLAVGMESRYPRVRSLSHSFISSRLARVIFNPHVGFVIFLFVLIATHFSPLANAGMRNPNIHCLELILFLTGGLIYYYPVMKGNPTPIFVPYSTRTLSLFAMMLPETMVGFFLYSGNRLLHDLPHGMSMSHGLSDQHTGGAIMWAMGMLIDTVWIVLAARDWFENERELAEAEDE